MSHIANTQKIKDLDELVDILDSRGAKKIVHCHGVFDLLHIGHIRHFNEARKQGDVLVVTITPDEFVNKGPQRPVFTSELRAESLASLDCVDYVAVNRWPTAVELIKYLKPDLYVKGSEYGDVRNDKTGKIVDEEEAVNSVGGRLYFTEDITYSSSNLLNEFFSPFSDSVKKYLREFSRRHDIESVLGYLEKASRVRVLTLGETILDEYVYCETLGKSGKEPILAARHAGAEMFAGGILAIANNLAAFTEDVRLVSYLGKDDPQDEFINSKLSDVVKATFLYENGPTIVKRRFVEQYPFQKLFEVYKMNGCEEPRNGRDDLLAEVQACLTDVDLVVVADYGHGMVDRKTVGMLCEKAPYLAVNAQVNAGNLGFNTISKYDKTDFICISEKELRLEARSRNGDLRTLVREAADRHQCDRVLITKGKEGCLCYSREEGFFEIPAFTGKIVDRIGSGDTVLTVASLCSAIGAPIEVTGFLGNVAGALAVGTVCNKTSLDKVGMMKNIIAMLK